MKNSIKFYSIVENLVPEYVKDEFPLVVEFLSQYYKSQENKSASLDIIHNIDKYAQVSSVANLTLTSKLTYPLEFESDIFIETSDDLPKNHGLIKIDNEIIWYDRLVEDTEETIECTIEPNSTSFTSFQIANSIENGTYWVGKIIYIKNENGDILSSAKILSIESGLSITIDRPLIPSAQSAFYSSDNTYTCIINGTKLVGCTRGFSATTSYDSDTTTDELVYEESFVETHVLNSEITNLSIIFLTEFLKKIKTQITPGFEDKEFYEKINEETFINNINQFYSSKGTDCAFELLFRALFGEDVSIIRPRDYLIEPSNAQYNTFRELVVEPIEGDPRDLENGTLYQDEYLNIPQSKGTVSKVESIQRGDKFYYRISLDQTKENQYYSNIGEFSIHPKSKTTVDILSNSDFIDVDSTIGFPESGELEVVKIINASGQPETTVFGNRIVTASSQEIVERFIVKYTSKTSTQFLGCIGIDRDIPINTSVRLNTFAYGNDGTIKVSVGGVISSVNIETHPYYSSINERMKIDTLGANLDDIRSENWFYNIQTTYDVEKIEFKFFEEKSNQIGNRIKIYTYEVTIFDDNILKSGDSVSLLYSKGKIQNGTIVKKTGIKSFLVVGFEELNESLKYTLRRNILKVSSRNYPELSSYSANVQNVYVDSDKNIFINSQSLPNYFKEPLYITDRSVVFSGSYTDSEIINVNSHGFYTGDAVVYEPGEGNNTLNLKKGIYFIYVVDSNNIKISRSRETINTNNFIKVTGQVTNNKFLLKKFTNKELEKKKLLPQNIFRKISNPTVPSNYDSTKTKPGTIGLLVNGVEILNYKSNDIIYYGNLEEVYPTSSGNGYDITNPPYLSIEDSSGTGANGYVSITGHLQRVDIIEPGFDYIETPTANIFGGNGKGAEVSLNLVSVEHSSAFNANVGISTLTNIIGFSTYHKFRNNEVVSYDPKEQTKISGLSTNSNYYVSVIDPLNIKLYNKFEDSIAGINTVNLIGVGTGRHYLTSIQKKKKIGSVQVTNRGSGYQTKKRTVNSVGIKTFSSIINIDDHGYNDGEIVVYTTSDTNIGGLNSGSSYYVTVVDKDKFKLSNIGLGITESDYFYKSRNYINFSTTGVGTHYFNYEPITISISGKTGIGLTHFTQAQLNPIFVGEITSVHLENKGNNYGTDIINFEKVPNITLLTGKNAQAKAVLSNGKIVSVIITNLGTQYYSTPEIKVIGKGSGAVLVPILENNRIKEIKIVSGGGGYDEGTLINIVPAGSECKFGVKIKNWRVNLFERLLRNNQITPDDGVLYEGKNDKNGIEYTHIYAPRKLRQSVLGQRIVDGKIVYNQDLEVINDSESTSLTHSPIIGWAYDGNPIYGPYGYSMDSSGNAGAVKQIISGYELKNTLNVFNRPNYPEGFFVEDYYFADSGDLDEHNGRICITPEFPNGVYAYFCTISNELPEKDGAFKSYKLPKFPYIIGDSYKSNPIDYNFLSTSNLNKFNLNDSSLLRNTKPYGFINENTYYDYINDPNKLKKEVSKIKSVSGGSVDDVKIIRGGDGYLIGDEIHLSDKKTRVFVSELSGKDVNTITSETIVVPDVEFVPYANSNSGEFIGFSTIPHNLNQNDIISITSSYDNNIITRVNALKPHTLNLRAGIDSSSVTGIVTYLSVYGSLNYPNIRENDIYYLGTEQVKILNIYPDRSEVRILREQFGTVGITSNLVGTSLTENPRKFRANFGLTTSYDLIPNKEIYFDPTVSIGLGTTGGVGITSTLFLYTNKFRHPVAIGTGSTTFLYFEDIKDLQEYAYGGYVDIVDATNTLFNTTKKEIISIGSTSIKIDFDTSSLSGIGVTAYLNKWVIKVIPTQSIYLPNHGLKTGDSLIYSANGGTRVSISTNGTSSFELLDGQEVYVANISNDLIGISTVLVGLDSTGTFVGIGTIFGSILYFNSVGTGDTHSFTTNYINNIIGDVSKNKITVETDAPHGLSRNDIVGVNVLSGITTNIVVAYNKKYRRVLIDPLNFVSSDIDTAKDTIRIYNHGLITGQKVIHTCSGSPVGGLENDKIYYAIVVSGSKIRLSSTYYDSIKFNPDYIKLTSVSSGTISKINPPINLVKDSEVVFDMSDSSLSFNLNGENRPGFRLDFYEDGNFNTNYETSRNNKKFDIKRFGIVGVDSTAKVTLSTKNLPKNLYYKLTPIDIKSNTLENIEVFVDNEILGNNKINTNYSVYNGHHSIVSVSSTSFTYNIPRIPEFNSYDSNLSKINYSVLSSSTKGAISKLNVSSSHKNLKSLPEIVDVDYRGALLYLEGQEIGKVTENNIEIIDIGADYSSDFSLRPTGKFSSLFEIEPSYTIDNIELVSRGKNYSISPNLILVDKLTKNQISDVIINYDIKSHEVKVEKNTINIFGNNGVDLIPTNNSNGVGINSIQFNPANNTVIVGLSKSYSNSSEFPFYVNDRIIIENVSVGIGSTLKGYNSSEYNYSSFDIVNVHPNIGGIGASITYSMSGYLNSGDSLGTFDSLNSSGKVIRVSDLPTFKVNTKKNQFSKNEKIKSNRSTGIVEEHYFDRDIIKVLTFGNFNVGNKIRGLSSNIIANINNIKEFKVDYNVKSSTITKSGWKKETGFLNLDNQRIPDNDYYQYFSYSIQSKVEFDKWNETVNKLSHTSGFKKFSDLIVDSNSNSFGMNKEQNNSDISGIADIYSRVDTNCYYDFDLVRENVIEIDSRVGSNQITFNSRIIQDYIESIGNRVLVIDDISPQFNSNPRTNKFSVVDNFSIVDDYELAIRYKKYFFSVKDTIYPDFAEVGLISLLHDNANGFINQYGFVSNDGPLGSFDFSISSGTCQLEFYPTNFTENIYDISLLSFSLPEIASGLGSTSIGDVLSINSDHTQVSTSSTSIVVGISSTYRSSKVLVQIGSTSGDYYEINEFNLLNDGSNVSVSDYGSMNINSLNSYSTSGIATYNFNISGGDIIMEINPIIGYGSSINVSTFVVSIGNTLSTGISTEQYYNGYVKSHFTSISSSPTPSENVVASFDTNIFGCYYIATVEDLTNNQYQTSEICIVRNDTTSSLSEFGIIQSNDNIGEFTTDISGSVCRLLFTPNPDTDVEVRLGEFSLTYVDENLQEKLDLQNNSFIDFSLGSYTGTLLDVRKSFEITHKQNPVFQKVFNGESSDIVDISNNTILIPNHYFVTGEEVNYTYTDSTTSTNNSIGIGTTVISGIGSTDKLPGTLYIVKVSESEVRVAASASESLLTIPNVLEISSVGVGTIHKLTSKKQNIKSLISIDNIIQTPITSIGITTKLLKTISRTESIIEFEDTSGYYGSDLIKINNEIMRIRSVGFGSDTYVLVQRSLLGTSAEIHNIDDIITKISGNYNIVDNQLHFSEPPYGKIPFINPNSRPEEQDYFGLDFSSRFNGRVFIRSGIENTNNEVYKNNYLIDSISEDFTGFTTEFTLKSEGFNITGISTSNAIVLVNNILQFPTDNTGIYDSNAYKLTENAGITTITFEGNLNSDYQSDINLTNIPRGGIVLSFGSTQGLGYQPLVAAAGTSIVSSAGTIQSISIGYSGSGYRSGIQTTVNVGVSTSDSSEVVNIGIASISNGNIVSVAITNPGFGYTSSNPPTVIFDYPLSYYNIPLIYSSISSGIGTGAKIDIVVGQGSSIIQYNVSNYGFGYKVGDILTVEIGGITGIPTDTSLPFSEFQISVDSVYNDTFSAWTVGDLQVLDSIEELIDGRRKIFPIKIDGQQVSIRSRKGSNIDIQATLLVFINDVLQTPGEGYIFNGGSVIEFAEIPKEGDIIKILFYKGTSSVDTRFVDILEPIESGDLVTLNHVDGALDQNQRIVEQILNSDLINTNSYFGVGISSNTRTITLCKQTEDRFVDGAFLPKTRVSYEPLIFPTTNIIENVSTSSTQFFVESVRTFFDSRREYIQNNIDNIPQNYIRILTQENVSSAIGTAIVSSAGTITSVVISNGGVGYSTSPLVIIQNPIGIGSTSLAYSTISIGGTVSSVTISNAGSGYTVSNPPLVIIEPPSFNYEDIDNVSYEGDFGIIVGVATTSLVGVASTGIVFDLFVPQTSYLRDTLYNVGIATTGISGIQTNYLFVVNNSNIGNGVTALDSNDSIVGVGHSFLDNIYSAVSVSIAQTSVPGVGLTNVSRVVVSVENYNGLVGTGYSEFFGNYSWGLIKDIVRKNPKQFTANINGYSGIASSPIVIRSNSLKYIGYSTT